MFRKPFPQSVRFSQQILVEAECRTFLETLSSFLAAFPVVGAVEKLNATLRDVTNNLVLRRKMRDFVDQLARAAIDFVPTLHRTRLRSCGSTKGRAGMQKVSLQALKLLLAAKELQDESLCVPFVKQIVLARQGQTSGQVEPLSLQVLKTAPAKLARTFGLLPKLLDLLGSSVRLVYEDCVKSFCLAGVRLPGSSSKVGAEARLRQRKKPFCLTRTFFFWCSQCCLFQVPINPHVFQKGRPKCKTSKGELQGVQKVHMGYPNPWDK